MERYWLALLLLFGLFAPSKALASRDPYIKDYQVNITVQEDGSLDIKENITVDFGQAADRHGIFRIIPTQARADNGVYNTPVELHSITNSTGQDLTYDTWDTPRAHTVTWKIGDPNVTVQGIQEYILSYSAERAIRSQTDTDELYWNILGNYWDFPIDHFQAQIVFPDSSNWADSEVYLYSGLLGSTTNSLTSWKWLTNNRTLDIESTQSLVAKQGVTVSVSFPKGLVAASEQTTWEKYGSRFALFWYLLPLIILIWVWQVWHKHGDDPPIRKPPVAEFSPPDNISPVKMGLLITSGRWIDSAISATVIHWAVRKMLTIEERKKDWLGREIILRKTNSKDAWITLSPSEKELDKWLFAGKQETNLSELKKHLVENDRRRKKYIDSAIAEVENDSLISETGRNYSVFFFFFGFCFFVLMGTGIMFGASGHLNASLLLTAIVFSIFSVIMPKRTEKGTELFWRVMGLKLFMMTAEKYRQQFYEKEMIFDRLLPYAIIFGIAKLWVKKMQFIYGEQYFRGYHPAWLISADPNFDVSSLSQTIGSLSSQISSFTGTSSGSGGGGGAGGGGGGGGGGGW